MARRPDDGEEDGERTDALDAVADDEPSLPGEGSDPVQLPITDELDLHSFRPAEVADVVRDYLDAAYAKGIRELRIIHGRGIGVQRRTVQVLLGRDPRVVAFGDAPAEAGGWGATWVRLRDGWLDQKRPP
jgi:dsDNA-specific endonuclease/ATPase MutS2